MRGFARSQLFDHPVSTAARYTLVLSLGDALNLLTWPSTKQPAMLPACSVQEMPE